MSTQFALGACCSSLTVASVQRLDGIEGDPGEELRRAKDAAAEQRDELATLKSIHAFAAPTRVLRQHTVSKWGSVAGHLETQERARFCNCGGSPPVIGAQIDDAVNQSGI